MESRREDATLMICPHGGPTADSDVVLLRSDSGAFNIACMPEGMYSDLLLPPRGSGSELLYKICYNVQQSLRPLYSLHPDGLSWGTVSCFNTDYLMRPSVFGKIELRLDRDLGIYFEDVARIFITRWKSTDLFGGIPHVSPVGGSYFSMMYFEIKGRFADETNVTGPVSSLHLAIETTGYDQIVRFYAASSLSALRDLIHLIFKCNDIMITKKRGNEWWSVVEQYGG